MPDVGALEALANEMEGDARYWLAHDVIGYAHRIREALGHPMAERRDGEVER